MSSDMSASTSPNALSSKTNGNNELETVGQTRKTAHLSQQIRPDEWRNEIFKSLWKFVVLLALFPQTFFSIFRLPLEEKETASYTKSRGIEAVGLHTINSLFIMLIQCTRELEKPPRPATTARTFIIVGCARSASSLWINVSACLSVGKGEVGN